MTLYGTFITINRHRKYSTYSSFLIYLSFIWSVFSLKYTKHWILRHNECLIKLGSIEVKCHPWLLLASLKSLWWFPFTRIRGLCLGAVVPHILFTRENQLLVTSAFCWCFYTFGSFLFVYLMLYYNVGHLGVGNPIPVCTVHFTIGLSISSLVCLWFWVF